MDPKPHSSCLKGRALGYIWIKRKNWVGFNCWDDKNGCRARGQGSSNAQQSLALLHPVVLCGPYSLQLKPFPVIRTVTAPVLNYLVTGSAAGQVTSIKPSTTCPERFTAAVQDSCSHQGGRAQTCHPLCPPVLEKEKATRQHLNFFNVLQREKKKKYMHLHCNIQYFATGIKRTSEATQEPWVGPQHNYSKPISIRETKQLNTCRSHMPGPADLFLLEHRNSAQGGISTQQVWLGTEDPQVYFHFTAVQNRRMKKQDCTEATSAPFKISSSEKQTDEGIIWIGGWEYCMSSHTNTGDRHGPFL